MIRLWLAALVGVGGTSLVVSLLYALASRRRSLPRWHVLSSFSFTAFCLLSLVRYSSPSLAVQETVVRLLGVPALLFYVALQGISRELIERPPQRIERGLNLFALVFVVATALTPGGYILDPPYRLIELERNTYRLLGQPDWFMGVMLALVLAYLTLGLIDATRAYRRGLRLEALLTWGYAVPSALLIGWNTAWRTGWVSSDLYIPVEGGALLAFALSGVQLWSYQRGLQEERSDLLQELSERERLLSALLEQGLTWAGLLDPEGRVVLVSEEALRVARVSAEDVLGKQFDEGPWWRDDEAGRARLQSAIERARAGERDRFEARYRDPEGRVLTIDFSITPHWDTAGNLRWIIVEGRDVSVLLAMEERIRDTQRVEAVGRIAGGVAHDLNNLLTPVLAGAELLKSRLDEDSWEYGDADLIAEAATGAARLTQQLLAFARRGSTEIRDLDLGQVVEAALRLFRRTSDPNLTIVEEWSEEPLSVRGDSTQLESAVLNLLLNAGDALRGGGVLNVRTRKIELSAERARTFRHPLEPGVYACVEIDDDGPGMAPEVAAQAFEPFFTTKPRGKGTGLGLAAVLGTLRAVGGAVELETAVGQGARFKLWFPWGGAISQVRPAPEVSGWTSWGPPLRVLLVDDDDLTRKATTRLLEHLGCEVSTCSTGADALAAIERAEPELLLSDMVMPGMNGRELLRAVRARHGQLPMVLYSGFLEIETLDELGNDPCLRFLAKPFHREQLSALLSWARQITARTATG